MPFLPSFGSLLQGFTEGAQEVKTQRLQQDNADRQFKGNVLQYFLNHPDTPSDVRNQAGSMLMDMAMEHLGYKPATKQTRPLEKVVDQFVGTMSGGPNLSQLGRGAGAGTGNAQSPVGGTAAPQQPQGQSQAQGQGPQMSTPPQMPMSAQMEANRQPGQLLIPGLGAQRNLENQTGIFQAQRQAFADQITTQHEAAFKFLKTHVPEMSDREASLRAIGGLSAASASIFGKDVPGTMTGIELQKRLVEEGRSDEAAKIKPDNTAYKVTTIPNPNGVGMAIGQFFEQPHKIEYKVGIANGQTYNIPINGSTGQPLPNSEVPWMPAPSYMNTTTQGITSRIEFAPDGTPFWANQPYTTTRTPNASPNLPPIPGAPSAPAQGTPTSGAQPTPNVPGTPRGAGGIPNVPNRLPTGESFEKYGTDRGQASNIDNSIRLFAGTADGTFKGTFQLNSLLNNLVSAAKVAAAENADNVSVGTLVSRYGNLSPDEQQLAANLISMKEDLPGALRGIFGAPVARGQQMMKVMQDQIGPLLGSPEVLKKVQQNTLRTLLRNRAAKEIPIAAFDYSQGKRPKGQTLPSDPAAQQDLFHAYVMATGNVQAAKKEMQKDGWQ